MKNERKKLLLSLLRRATLLSLPLALSVFLFLSLYQLPYNERRKGRPPPDQHLLFHRSQSCCRRRGLEEEAPTPRKGRGVLFVGGGGVATVLAFFEEEAGAPAAAKGKEEARPGSRLPAAGGRDAAVVHRGRRGDVPGARRGGRRKRGEEQKGPQINTVIGVVDDESDKAWPQWKGLFVVVFLRRSRLVRQLAPDAPLLSRRVGFVGFREAARERGKKRGGGEAGILPNLSSRCCAARALLRALWMQTGASKAAFPRVLVPCVFLFSVVLHIYLNILR